MVHLREMEPADLELFYRQQLDPEANYMAAFTAKYPTDKGAFLAKWAKILDDQTIILRTIEVDGLVAGYVVCHHWFGDPEISYWLGTEFWGKGIASEALSAFLEVAAERPLLARVVKDNMGSIRVLEKNGFQRTGEDKGFSNARGEEVEEYIYRLE